MRSAVDPNAIFNTKKPRLYSNALICKNYSSICRIILLLKSLQDQGEISEKEKKDLYLSGSQPGVLYGLAKIHKALEDGIPSFGQFYQQ